MNRKSKPPSLSDPPVVPPCLDCGFFRLRVRYHPADDPAAPTILALHGFTGSGRDFDPLRRAMGTQAGWICPDWPGHGQSDAPAVIDPYLLPFCMAALDRLAGLRPAASPLVLLGYSMGGRLAWHWLLRRGPLPCFLIGASPGLASATERESRRRQDRRWIRLLTHSGIEDFCRQWEQQPIIQAQTTLPGPLRQTIARHRRENSPTGLIRSLKAVGAGNLPALWHHLHHCPPACLIAGTRDEKFASLHQSVATRYPGFTTRTIPNAGHAPHLENPSALAHCLNPLLPKASLS